MHQQGGGASPPRRRGRRRRPPERGVATREIQRGCAWEGEGEDKDWGVTEASRAMHMTARREVGRREVGRSGPLVLKESP